MWNVEPHYAEIRESKVATFTDVRIGYFRAVAPLSEMRCLGGSIALQNVRRLLRDCDDGRVGVAANDGRHHRRIDDFPSTRPFYGDRTTATSRCRCSQRRLNWPSISRLQRRSA